MPNKVISDDTGNMVAAKKLIKKRAIYSINTQNNC